jgi:hypothetical protein
MVEILHLNSKKEHRSEFFSIFLRFALQNAVLYVRNAHAHATTQKGGMPSALHHAVDLPGVRPIYRV